MKREIRILGIDDSPFEKHQKGKVLVVGTIFRGGEWIDGILSTKVTIDGKDSTEKLISMINKCKFKTQLRAIVINGIALGGFNIIDIEKLSKKTRIPVIVVVRHMPDFKNIKKTLEKLGMKSKYKLIQNAGTPLKFKKVYFQFKGTTEEDAREILKISCTHSFIPEQIRVAHLIASGIIEGESRGRA